MSFESELIKIAMDNPARSAEDFRKIVELTEASDLNYNGSCIQTLLMPKIFTQKIYDYITSIAAKCFPILNKIIAQYRANPDYRLIFGFEPELEELILLSDTRITPIPVSRIDFFLDEDNCKAKLCEINTDGTSAMNEDRILGSFLDKNSSFQAFMQHKEYRKFELFDTFVNEFLHAYQSHVGDECATRVATATAPAPHVANANPPRVATAPHVATAPRTATAPRVADSPRPVPRVAIVDFLDKGTVNEFKRFQEAFTKHGIEAEVCDIRNLSYKNSKLTTPSGMVVDAIYRRAVTVDIMANYGDVLPFIQAVKDGAVCLVGGFCTQIAHNKLIFYILRHPATLAFLTKDEKRFVEEYIPLTFLLTKESIHENNALSEKDKWIIKPCDAYGSKGVYAGCDTDEAKWESLLRENLKNHYLLQQFIKPYRSPNLDFHGENFSAAYYGNTTGVFCYNEKPYGIYSRLAEGNIISTGHDEKAVPTILLLD